MCHQTAVILRCGHKSETLSSISTCPRLRKLQQQQDAKFSSIFRRKKLADCGNVTTDRHSDDSRICGACYERQKKEKRAQREREQRAEAKRNEQKSDILRNRVEQDRRERERQQRVEAERQRGFERDARRRQAEQEEDQRKRERRAYREDMARQREVEERQRQQERKARAERAEREARERSKAEKLARERADREAKERARAEKEARERAKVEAEKRKAAERIAERHWREREEKKRREQEKAQREREARERRQRAAEQARQTAASSSRQRAPPPGRLADRPFLSPAAEAQRQHQLRTQLTSPSRPVQKGSAAVPPLRVPARKKQSQLPVHQRGAQRPVQVVSPIPMHFAQAASVHRVSEVVDQSEPYYGPGPSGQVDPVDDILNMYQRSPTFDVSEPFNPGFQQANTTNLNRLPGKHVGLGIYAPSSSQPSGIRRYVGRPPPPSERVLEKAKQSRIPFPPRRKASTATDRLTRSNTTKSKASTSTWKSGDSGATPPPGTWRRDRDHHPKGPRPVPVPQGPNPIFANLQATNDKQRRLSNNSGSSMSSIRNVLSRLTSKSKSRSQANPFPLGRKISGIAQRVSGTFKAPAAQKSPSPEWACYDARQIHFLFSFLFVKLRSSERRYRFKT
ncbi:hypothetical protein B0T21DRAFT_374441 [Apiosordaria backusii]|uniref:Uncharacterized protein n=1 Tax=Apiosordaria backusii TaxID=314023 RepID=A0AA40DWH1_9PEZI|nr:hypothetical protein B0T21DRAFT_374441 [Apiosordaria backusii]